MQNIDDMRPASWDEYIGQEALKRRLSIHIRAAKDANRPLEHLLLIAPPGSGKTTLAVIIATELEDPLETMTMPVKTDVLANIIKQHHGILLLDELHRSTPRQQEDLLPLLEFGYIQNSRGKKIFADFLTIVGATTEPQKVIAPLYDRFAIKPDYDEYTPDEMTAILSGMAVKSHVELLPEEATTLALATGGSPRVARQLVLAARDLYVTDPMATPEDVLALVRIEPDGLTEQHLKYLRTLRTLGGLAGLRPICNHMRLNDAIVNELERLLVKNNLIEFSGQGRELTDVGIVRTSPARTHRRNR